MSELSEQRVRFRLEALINQASPGAQWWSREEVLALQKLLAGKDARIIELENNLRMADALYGGAVDVIAKLDAGRQPIALDLPDAPGWWARNSVDTGQVKGEPQFVARFVRWDVRGDEVFFQWGFTGELTALPVDEFKRIFGGKWTRLHMPWETVDATPAADPDARTVWEPVDYRDFKLTDKHGWTFTVRQLTDKQWYVCVRGIDEDKKEHIGEYYFGNEYAFCVCSPLAQDSQQEESHAT